MPVLHELCQALDLSRPVILEKHIRELGQFSHTIFRQSDFMEPILFDRFEIEIFPEKKSMNDAFHAHTNCVKGVIS